MNIFFIFAFAIAFAIFLNFGLLPAVVVSIVMLLLHDTYVAYLAVTKELQHKREEMLLSKNVVVSIDKCVSAGEDLFLVYLQPNRKFLFQGKTSNEISSMIVNKFMHLQVFVERDGELISIHNGLNLKEES